MGHTENLENFIKKVGYQLIFENGFSEYKEIPYLKIIMGIYRSRPHTYQMSHMGPQLQASHFFPLPMNVLELFEELKKHVRCKRHQQITPFKYGKFTIAPTLAGFADRCDLFWNSSEIDRPIQGTSRIIKDQIKHNYHVMFPEKHSRLAIESK